VRGVHVCFNSNEELKTWFPTPSICPGRHFSAETLWLISAHMIATMDIGKAVDENGNMITPPLEFTTGFVRFVFFFFWKKVVLFIFEFEKKKSSETVQM